MTKERVVRRLTDEQRKRIMSTPGVVVHRRDPSKKPTRFIPSIRVEKPISVRELLGRDEVDEDESE
jgi:hypothetical protein